MKHITRFSDSSLYDEVCINCGKTDRDDNLNDTCCGPKIFNTLDEYYRWFKNRNKISQGKEHD